jgi:hypothetical protein
MSEERKGWIGVDLDGTLAEYHGWEDIYHIGKPIPAMVKRVKAWLEDGIQVRIMTARVCGMANAPETRVVIRKWCLEHLGEELSITHEKDFDMIELWDDRAVAVELNTGRILGRN